MKKLSQIFLIVLAMAACSIAGAAQGELSALADAKTVMESADRARGLITPAEFAERFGDQVELANLGADAYRNVRWILPPLVSIDAELELQVGFNYGNFSEWWMELDFSNRPEVGRNYFRALCGGLAELTGTDARAVFFAPPTHAMSEVCSWFPISDDARSALEVSARGAKIGGKITITVVDASAAMQKTVVTTSRDVVMYRWPARSADHFRTLAPNKKLLAIDAAREKERDGRSFFRVVDRDGEIGWVLSEDVSIFGVRSIDLAFDDIDR